MRKNEKGCDNCCYHTDHKLSKHGYCKAAIMVLRFKRSWMPGERRYACTNYQRITPFDLVAKRYKKNETY